MSRMGERPRRGERPARAVIDIGSNTVRLVVYDGTARAPEVVWNEKVAARLGRDLSRTGRIPDDAADEALTALARYARLLADREIVDIQTVATAAAREAKNGGGFLDRVAALGLEPRLLSGEEEATAAAMGAIGAFPGITGTVADLGGGSLELVPVRDDRAAPGISLPLGTLRLPALAARPGAIAATIGAGLAAADLSMSGGALVLIGGTWRALAHYAMHTRDYFLSDPHGFTLTAREARSAVRQVSRSNRGKLAQIAGITAMRADYLPDAVSLLPPLLERLEPERVVFSSWGLREGLLFARLDAAARAQDPLLAGVQAFCTSPEATVTQAARLTAWTAELTPPAGGRSERLRLAAAQLSMALQRVEPNLRADHAVEWSLDKRWIDCMPDERAMLAAALTGSLGRTDPPPRLRPLAGDKALHRAITWGLGFRLGRRLGGGTTHALAHSRLKMDHGCIELCVAPDYAMLAAGPVLRDLDALATWLRRPARLTTAAQPAVAGAASGK